MIRKLAFIVILPCMALLFLPFAVGESTSISIVGGPDVRQDLSDFQDGEIDWFTVETRDGRTVLITHGGKDGSTSVDPSSVSHDLLIACYPNEVREANPGEYVLGSWSSASVLQLESWPDSDRAELSVSPE